jgi:hypothetical protein
MKDTRMNKNALLSHNIPEIPSYLYNVEKKPLPNSRRPSHGGISFASGVGKMSHPNPRKSTHGGVSIV